MDIKNAIDYLSKTPLIACIIELKIHGYLISYINSFLTDKKIWLIIDKHKNKK